MKVVKFSEFSLNENLNDTPEQYIKVILLQIKKKLENIFAPEEEGDVEVVKKFSDEEEPTTLAEMGVELESLEISRYSRTLDNLKLKFSDADFLYDLMIGIDIKEAIPKKDKQFDLKDVKKCFIKFKKYDKTEPGEVLAELTDNIKIEDINQDLLVELKIKLDEQDGESEGEKFEIETE